MATYPDYKHGALGEVGAEGVALGGQQAGQQAFVYIGVAPSYQIKGRTARLHRPTVVHNMAEARRLYGWSDDWTHFTLCEAMAAHFSLYKTGPIVAIDVGESAGVMEMSMPSPIEISVNPDMDAAGQRLVLTYPESQYPFVEDSFRLRSIQGHALTEGVDYSVACDRADSKFIITLLHENTLNEGDPIPDEETRTAKVYFKYLSLNTVANETNMADANCVGAASLTGNTGAYAVRDVYPATGMIPAFLGAPGLSQCPNMYNALIANSQAINTHWYARVYADIPQHTTANLSVTDAADWKNTNNYTADNASVFFPRIIAKDGHEYHLSTLYMAALQKGMEETSGIPWRSASNTPCPYIDGLALRDANGSLDDIVLTDDLVGAALNANGIDSAAYVSGRWVLWGTHAASYSQETQTSVNVFDTSLAMLYYLINDFQRRRARDVDKPMTLNTLRAIVAEEQARLDALVAVGALIWGEAEIDAENTSRETLMAGDFRILLNVTTTPLAKSLTAVANWTDKGYDIYFEGMAL